MADKFAGRLDDSPYFGNYERWTVPWRMALGEVDGEPVIIILHRDTDVGTVRGVVRLDVTDRRITRIADYLHCPWLLGMWNDPRPMELLGWQLTGKILGIYGMGRIGQAVAERASFRRLKPSTRRMPFT